MLKYFVRLCMCVIVLFNTTILFAQQQTDSTAIRANEAHDFMRSNDKIYVVMAVSVTILIGLILYLVRLDIKMTKAERL